MVILVILINIFRWMCLLESQKPKKTGDEMWRSHPIKEPTEIERVVNVV